MFLVLGRDDNVCLSGIERPPNHQSGSGYQDNEGERGRVKTVGTKGEEKIKTSGWSNEEMVPEQDLCERKGFVLSVAVQEYRREHVPRKRYELYPQHSKCKAKSAEGERSRTVSQSLVQRCGFGRNPSIRPKRKVPLMRSLSVKGASKMNKASPPHLLQWLLLFPCERLQCQSVHKTRGLVREENIKGDGHI